MLEIDDRSIYFTFSPAWDVICVIDLSLSDSYKKKNLKINTKEKSGNPRYDELYTLFKKINYVNGSGCISVLALAWHPGPMFNSPA